MPADSQMIKYIATLTAVIFLFSCSKEEKQTKEQSKNPVQQNTEQENPADTNLTPEEKFSSSIMVDFLNDSDDEGFGDYLETEIFKMGANYDGAAVIELLQARGYYLLRKIMLLKIISYKNTLTLIRMNTISGEKKLPSKSPT